MSTDNVSGTSGLFSVYLGMNAKIYIGGEVFGNVKDVTMNFSRATADVTTRSNDGWRANVGTLREATVSFQMVRFGGDDDRAKDATTIIKAFTSNGDDSLLKAAVLDAAPEKGGEGVFGDWSVTSCNRSEALEDAVTYDVELSLTRYLGWYSNGSATLSPSAPDGLNVSDYIPASDD